MNVGRQFWFVSARYAAGGVDTLNYIITDAPPIWRKLIGQDIRKIGYRVEFIRDLEG